MSPKKIFAALSALLIAAALHAQSVTATFSATPLSEALKEVENQTGCSFFYDAAQMGKGKSVNATFKNASLTAVLDKILGKEYSYKIDGNIVSIITRVTGARTQTPARQAETRPEPAKAPPHPVKTINVNGTVVDQAGVPVIGAAVMLKDGTGAAAMTDLDGRFSISVPEGATLHFSCMGYQTVQAPAAATMAVVMSEDTQMLEEVVVVGYGVQNKESVVGAISQVSTEALVNSGTVNISNSLAGKLSGVQTFQTSGQPGKNDASIYIRGLSSWNNDSPLVMVDGVEREFGELDPNEVATISVLKDASATAVFGAKGANGVILVTTKTGMKGRPKMKLSVDYGLDTPTRLPQHVSSAKIVDMYNVALRNEGAFASQYSDDVINSYRDQTNPLRYPDNDWYDMLIRDFAPTMNANFNLSGGGERVKYFVSLGYLNEGSIIDHHAIFADNNFGYNRFNYRTNLDIKVTPTTTLSAKLGGYMGITNQPNATSTTGLFKMLYDASPAMFPAYWPHSAVEDIFDKDYPDASTYTIYGGIRLSDDAAANISNPYLYIAYDSFKQYTYNKLNTDFELSQDLGFITKGLTANVKAAFTTSYQRTSKTIDRSYSRFSIDWDAYDRGESPWYCTNQTYNVVQPAPLEEAQSNNADSPSVIFYWEGAVNYSRKFNDHSVSGLILFNQRESMKNASFPVRSEGLVGRATYNYKGKYFAEANLGYTGSMQFAPSNRFGFFPAFALGYTVSKERFWKEAMPWWSKFKLRYSDGYVGTDKATEDYLYYSSFSVGDGDFYIRDAMANLTARWETAHKRDLGLEMGWFDDALTVDLDLFDEHRYDMLVTPVVPPTLAIDYKDVNTGELKKHGFELEMKYRNSTSGGLYYEIGGMLGMNENRILAYEDIPYVPDYQKKAGKAHGAMLQGLNQIDSGFFSSVDEVHSYVMNYSDWDKAYVGMYKYADFNADGYLDVDDYHPIHGQKYPSCTYSSNLAFGYKGWSLSFLIYCNSGKYTSYRGLYDLEFYKGDLTAHVAQLDYWTPQNDNPLAHRSLTTSPVLEDAKVEGHTWRKSDYVYLKEAYLAYRFNSDYLKKTFGIDGLSLTLSGNNLLTWTNLIEGDPQQTQLMSGYYPVMRTVKLGLKLDF